MKFLGFCWPHDWKYARRRFGFCDPETGKTVGTARKVCRRCAKQKFMWEKHLPEPTIQSVIESRFRVSVLEEIAKKLFRVE